MTFLGALRNVWVWATAVLLLLVCVAATTKLSYALFLGYGLFAFFVGFYACHVSAKKSFEATTEAYRDSYKEYLEAIVGQCGIQLRRDENGELKVCGAVSLHKIRDILDRGRVAIVRIKRDGRLEIVQAPESFGADFCRDDGGDEEEMVVISTVS